MSEFKSDYYEYTVEWAEEYETWSKDKVSKLQAEIAESARIRFELRTDNAKLRAVVDMTREILVEAEDYEKRTGKTISWLNKLRDAIKEVE
jgi:hypothetical protein